MKYDVNAIDQLKPILKGFRKHRKLSQNQLAKRLGVSQQTYQAREANPQNVSVERFFRVLNAMSVQLSMIDKKEMNKPIEEDAW